MNVQHMLVATICSYLSCILMADSNYYAFFNLPTTMLKQVSKEETRAFSRQDEKLRTIKDLKMPMARFINGILIGQAEQYILAVKNKMSLTARGKKSNF